MDRTRRLGTLDGLRGLAALLVMLFHGHEWAPLVVPRGYLAVDLFFALSGFVIARAWDERLRAGSPLRQFALQRVIRIWPMYAIGACIGMVLHGGSVASLFMLPDPTSTMLYPANVAMWSLLAELVVNLIYARLAPRIGPRTIGAVLAVSALAVAWGGIAAGSLDSGAFWSNLPLGLARAVYSFTAGVALLRLQTRRTPRPLSGWLAWPLLAALVLAVMPGRSVGSLWDVAMTLALFPALVWLGSLCEAPGARAMGPLGDLSYPLYCIHMPILFVIGSGSPAVTLGLCLALPPIALALDRYVDRPARRRLQELARRLEAKPSLA